MTSAKSLTGYVVRSQRTRFLVMVSLLVVAGVLEGLGVATLLPVLRGIGSGAAVTTSPGLPTTQRLESMWADAVLGTLLVVLVVVFTLKALVLYAAGLNVGRIVARVDMELRIALMRAITGAEWRHIVAYPKGYIANALSAETTRTGSAIQTLAQAVADGTLVVVYVALALIVSWQVGVAAILGGSLILLLLRGRVSISRAAGTDQVHILRSILARMTDALPSIKPLKAMAREAYLLPRLEEQSREFFDAHYRGIAAAEVVNKAREPLLVAALALGLWATARYTSLDTAATLVLALLFYRTVTSITGIQQRWISVVVGEASYRSLMEHIDAAERAHEPAPSGAPGDAMPLRTELSLENVSFAYGERRVLNGASAVLSAGRFVAVVGPSGSGKTTLTDIVTGLLRPTAGRVLVDGVDLTTIDVRRWRRSIGYVPQEAMLFSDTVRANIALGDPGVGDDDVERALRAASAWDFVAALPGGTLHRIGEAGSALSGGEKQRIAIARALAASPSLLVMDEPTSGLDAVAETEVCGTIASLKGRMTILVVSHAPAIHRVADEVWRVEDSRISVARSRADGP